MTVDDILTKLLEAWQDEGPPEEERAELLSLLETDTDLRRRFAEQVHLIGSLRASTDQNPRWLALFDLIGLEGEAGDTVPLSFDAATMDRISPGSRKSWYEHPSVWAVAAALAFLAAASVFIKPSGKSAPAIAAVATEDPFVAVVIATSQKDGKSAGTYLKPGEISQDSGWLTLQTLNGVSVTLDGPFRAQLIDHERIRLNEGRARVRVPQGAEGFKLDSPAFDVVDLGTEFAAVVNSDGTGTCRVFEGKADVSLLDSIGEVKRTRRLVANESLRLTPSQQEMRVIAEANSDYPEIKQPPRPLLELPLSYASDVIALKPVGYWRFEEINAQVVRNEVAGDIRLLAFGSAAIAAESGGNHSGELTKWDKAEYFQVPRHAEMLLAGDFSISMFAQFDWLQNFALISATHYDRLIQGNSFILQSYASFRRSGLNGTGLHAVLRDPPGWDGGTEVYGNTLIRPLYWHHIAATRKGGQITLYLDGVVVARENAGSMPLDCTQCFVGRLNGNGAQSRTEARGLVGHLDELAIFTRALTDKEILKLSVSEK